jgi:hypothetical protein
MRFIVVCCQIHSGQRESEDAANHAGKQHGKIFGGRVWFPLLYYPTKTPEEHHKVRQKKT